jgi:hypothetical protein
MSFGYVLLIFIAHILITLTAASERMARSLIVKVRDCRSFLKIAWRIRRLVDAQHRDKGVSR